MNLYLVTIAITFDTYQFYVVSETFADAEVLAKAKPSDWKYGKIKSIELIKEPVLLKE